MREILFRGKQVSDGEWIEGYVFPQVIDGGYAPLCITTEPICANDYSEILGDWAIVDSSTVGQYTGLTDKNGKKIFEGDIIRVKYSIRCPIEVGNSFRIGTYDTDYIASVIFDDCRFCLAKANGETREIPLSSENIEVIGNIHDDPEMLEGKS